MNQSIYLMLGMAYGSVCVVGFMIYRGMKKNQEFLREQEQRLKSAARG